MTDQQQRTSRHLPGDQLAEPVLAGQVRNPDICDQVYGWTALSGDELVLRAAFWAARRPARLALATRSCL